MVRIMSNSNTKQMGLIVFCILCGFFLVYQMNDFTELKESFDNKFNNNNNNNKKAPINMIDVSGQPVCMYAIYIYVYTYIYI